MLTPPKLLTAKKPRRNQNPKIEKQRCRYENYYLYHPGNPPIRSRSLLQLPEQPLLFQTRFGLLGIHLALPR